MNEVLWILAQDPAAPTAKPADPASMLLFPALMIALVTFMVLSSRSQKKREQRTRESMFAQLAKNDRVLTIGGIIGTILAVKENEVILKVDESTNTKMTFLKSAIQRVLSDETAAASEKA
jgi:preprotein translocase subunit YajC